MNDSTSEDRTLAVISYIGGFFGSFLVPLVIFLLKRSQSRFVAYHAMQAIIFHAVILVGYFISGLLYVILIGMLLGVIVGLLSLVFSILASVAAYKGRFYEIPIAGKYARQIAGI